MIKTHSVDVELAQKVGFDEANVLGFIAYWVKNNRDNEKNFYDGKYWTYNSTRALVNQFPYWTARKISGLIEKLEKIGAIIKANYNKNKFDKTSWYTLTDKFMYLVDPNPEMEDTNPEMEDTNPEMDFTNPEMEDTNPEMGFTKTEMEDTKTEIIIGNNYKPITKPIAKTITKPIAGETPLPPLPDFIDPELWEQYLAYKKERKEKLSMLGMKMKFLQWDKWASEGIDVNACIREAMANEWQGVFKPKGGARAEGSLEDFAYQHGLDLDLAQKVKTNQMHLNQAKTQMAVRKFCADEHAIEAEIL